MTLKLMYAIVTSSVGISASDKCFRLLKVLFSDPNVHSYSSQM